MLFWTFPKLYQICAIFPIVRDPAPFPTDWIKNPVSNTLSSVHMIYGHRVLPSTAALYMCMWHFTHDYDVIVAYIEFVF